MSMPQSPEEMKAFNRQMVADFRAHDPKLSGRKILLLTTTGARTGTPHTTPMTYARDGDRVLVIASNAGAARHPDWYRNLSAHPTVTVELHDETYQARASVAAGEERDRLWTDIVAQMPYFADHQARVSRQIPVVILERVE